MSGFDDAVKLRAVIQNMIREELSRERPAARYAVVNSIDWTDRSCMVTFIGETDPVRVVFTSVAPSAVGQEVRIAGKANDRYIDAIRGISDGENRTVELEAEITARQPIFGRWALENNYTAPNGTATLPLLASTVKGGFDPVGGLVNIGGKVTIPVSGYYRIDGNMIAQCESAERAMILRRDIGGNINNGENMHEAKSYAYGDGGDGSTYIALWQVYAINELLYFDAGDVVYMQTYGTRNATVYALPGTDPNAGRMTTFAIDLRLAGPKYVAPVA